MALVKMLGSAVFQKRAGLKKDGGKVYSVHYNAGQFYNLDDETIKAIFPSCIKVTDENKEKIFRDMSNKYNKKLYDEAVKDAKENDEKIERFEKRARGFAEKEMSAPRPEKKSA